MADLDERTVAMVKEAASLMGDLLIHNRESKAVFRPDHTGKWHWTAIKEKFTMQDFVNHLTGNHCLGTYLLAPDSTVKFLAFDLDVRKQGKYYVVRDLEEIEALEAAGHYAETATPQPQGVFDPDLAEGNLEAALHEVSDPAFRWVRIVLWEAIQSITRQVKANLDLPELTIITGGGAHIFVPLPEPMPAADARSAGIEIMASLPNAKQRNEIFFDYGTFQELSIEVFPKQDSIEGKNFGNLIRLPFGWHYEAGIRTFAVDPSSQNVPVWIYPRVNSLKTLQSLKYAVGV